MTRTPVNLTMAFMGLVELVRRVQVGEVRSPRPLVERSSNSEH